jgi:very-short-patch-repair endonuclease
MANERARQLRKFMTRQEVKLWMHLRTWRRSGFHFRRQAPRDGYILDFVCLTERLIVEIDGGQHNLDDHASSDRERDQHFERQGFKTLRFWNSDVDRNLWGVLETIDRELRARSAPPRPFGPTLPLRGRDSAVP